MVFTLEQILKAYEVGGSMKKAANVLNISKTTFRNLYYNLQGLCIRCNKCMDKSGLLCSECLQADREGVAAKLPITKSCAQCNCEIKRTETQNNISWTRQKICDVCERKNSLDCLKLHYKNNKEKYLIKTRARAEYRKAYFKTERGRISKLTSNSKRRAQKRKTATSNISIYISKLFAEQNYCYYCKSSDKLQIEHLIPLSRGGGHTEDNVTLACKACNLQKGNKLPSEFENYLKELNNGKKF